MFTGQADRKWLIGGLLVAAVLVATGWFFLISPQNGRTAAARTSAESARTQLATLQHRLTELKEQNDHKAEYQAQLDADKAALPATADLATFLRSLQAGDDGRGVVSSVAVGEPMEQSAAGVTVYALPVTVTATGTAAKLEGMLDHLQQVQPRAVLIKSADLAAEDGASVTASSTLTITMQVFVSSPEGAKATPAPTGAAAQAKSN
jgi:Tfp pilus assembly protein PilO